MANATQSIRCRVGRPRPIRITSKTNWNYPCPAFANCGDGEGQDEKIVGRPEEGKRFPARSKPRGLGAGDPASGILLRTLVLRLVEDGLKQRLGVGGLAQIPGGLGLAHHPGV